MKKLFVSISLFFVLLFNITLTAQTCEVTYIGNEGFLVETGGKKVLCDAIFGNIKGDWCDQPDSLTLEKLIAGQPPFDKIDLLTISHKHVDHFNEKMTIQFMLNHPETKVICPTQVETIFKSNPEYSKVKQNIIAVTPGKLKDKTIEAAEIRIRILRLEHSHYMETDPNTGEQKNRHADIENLGFVFDINGYKIYHCGDTNPFNKAEYSTFALQKEKVDLAFLERMFLGGKEQQGFKTIQNFIQPKQIILMHLTPARKEMFKNYTAKLKDVLPDIFIFEKPLGKKKF